MMAVANTPDMLSAALELARQGFRVFPVHTPRFRGDGSAYCSCSRADCDRIGKHPRTRNGLHDGSTDEAHIREWWAKWPDANVGLVMGKGTLVLDVDVDKGGTSNGLDLPDTMRVVTGGGGEHIYLRCEGEVPNSVELVGPGLDIRADGGYVLAPPSLHESGRRYAWDVGQSEEVGPAPKWLLERARAKRPGATVQVADADAFIAGGRNDALTALAGSMRRRGFGAPAITAALLLENAARCRPMLDEAEVRSIAEGVAKRYAPSDPVRGWTLSGWDTLSQRLPPIPWLCRELVIAPGAPFLVAGYGYSGKTAALQSLAVSVAAGLPAWGRFPIEAGSVVHVDYEQGKHLTQLRYQRLALAAGVWEELSGRLELSSLPPTTLDAGDGVDKLRGLCEGRRLCIIDSLKAAFPSADENSSDVRKWLDQLTRVSEETGCVIAVIHHARKPNKDQVGGSKMAIRGSGAIFDACSGIFVFEGEKGKPTMVAHEKARITGVTVQDFALAITDVPIAVEELPPLVADVTAVDGITSDDGLLRRGLRVAVAELERPPTALEAMRARVLRNLAERGQARSRSDLVVRLGTNRKLTLDAISALVDEGFISVDRGAIRLPGQGAEKAEQP